MVLCSRPSSARAGTPLLVLFNHFSYRSIQRMYGQANTVNVLAACTLLLISRLLFISYLVCVIIIMYIPQNR